MKTIAPLASVAALGLAAACGGRMAPPASPAPEPPAAMPSAATEPGTRPTLRQYGRYPYSEADVKFMTGMIPHHAQAVIMAGWAESHGAREDVRILCERIVVGQTDEIALMRTWLRDRGEFVPEPDATHHMMTMPDGQRHQMLMPGMLSEEEMAALDAARGPEWDRLFLIGMIKHHQGAIDMVDELFESYGAAQDEVVFRFASDVYADQSTEIDRMYLMLESGGVRQ